MIKKARINRYRLQMPSMICEPLMWLKISASSLSQLDNKVLLFVQTKKASLSAAERFASFGLYLQIARIINLCQAWEDMKKQGRAQKRGSKRSGHMKQDQDPQELDLEDHHGARYHNVDIKSHNKLEMIIKKAPKNLLYISLCNRKLQWPFITLITQQQFDNLVNLSIDGNRLGIKGCKYLSRGRWGSLQTLQLKNNFIEDSGLSHLVKSQLPRLELITLKQNMITDKAVPSILNNPWKRLRVLYLQDNQITYFGSIRFLSTHHLNLKGEYGFERLYLSPKHIDKLQAYRLRQWMKMAYPGLKFFDID